MIFVFIILIICLIFIISNFRGFMYFIHDTIYEI